MRGSIMRKWTREEHIRILQEHSTNKAAAAAYNEGDRGAVSAALVRYWRTIFVDHGGNLAAADRALAAMREYIKPSPDDDLGSCVTLVEKANSILVIPDQHAPYHHPDTFEFLARVKQTFQPDLVVNLGDELDYHALSFHDSDPNLDSAGMELEKGKAAMQELYDLFPNMLICHSNHGSMQYRRAKAHGIPVQMIKRYRDVIFPDHGAPGWSWQFGWRVNTDLGPVMFKHQSTNILVDAAHNQCNMVVGHNHGNFSIEYSASSAHLYWGAFVGCLIDKDSMAFAYGKHTLRKPIVGCMVILNGRPMLVPMILERNGRWIGRL